MALPSEVFAQIGQEIPLLSLSSEQLTNGINLIDLLSEKTNIVESKSEARRAIQANAIAINKIKTNAIDHNVSVSDFFYSKYAMIENGKKNKYLLQLTS